MKYYNFTSQKSQHFFTFRFLITIFGVLSIFSGFFVNKKTKVASRKLTTLVLNENYYLFV